MLIVAHKAVDYACCKSVSEVGGLLCAHCSRNVFYLIGETAFGFVNIHADTQYSVV